MELQRTFDGQLVPTADLPDDIIETQSGQRARRADCFVDCKGRYYLDDEDRYEADAELVHDDIDAHCQATNEYTEHEDYGSNYVYCAVEQLCLYESSVIDDIVEFIEDWADNELKDGEARKIARDILDRIHECDIECHHQYNEYASYAGSGVCIWSCEVGEVESQIELSGYDWADLDDLESILEEYNGDAFLYAFSDYDSETKKHKRRPYVDRGTITYYANPGGAWHFVIPADHIKDAVNDYLEEQ